jgi:hypothetical protein
LRSAAATAHTSITLHTRHDQHMSSLLRFLTAHGQHVRHLTLSSDPDSTPGLPALQFPPSVQLESLALSSLRVSLILGSGGQHSLGVLGGQTRLQTLSLRDCVIDKRSGGRLAAALKQLPALQDLTLTGVLRQALVPCDPEDILPFPGA